MNFLNTINVAGSERFHFLQRFLLKNISPVLTFVGKFFCGKSAIMMVADFYRKLAENYQENQEGIRNESGFIGLGIMGKPMCKT